MWQKFLTSPERRPAALAALYLILLVLLFGTVVVLSTSWSPAQSLAQVASLSPTAGPQAAAVAGEASPTVAQPSPSAAVAAANPGGAATAPATQESVPPTAILPQKDANPTPVVPIEERPLASRGERAAAEQVRTATPEPMATLAPEPTATPAPEPTVAPAPPSLAGKRVGLQVGHWQCANLPAEFASLRRSTGAETAGIREVDLNLKIARLTAPLLEAQGITVDIIPSTVPVKYQADAFVAIHGDANDVSGPRGFKLARSGRSRIPATDDALVAALYAEYGKATGLPRSKAITNDMVYYYAFNSGASHSVAATTPAAIMEMGYISNPTDRALMLNSSDVVAAGIARGIIAFLAAH